MHPAGRVSVQGFELAPELEHKRQSDRHFRCGHTQNEEIHHLSIRLRPPGARRHKGQPRRIQHNFERHQYENDVAPNEHANQPQREKHSGQQQPVFHRNRSHSNPPAAGREGARERKSEGAGEEISLLISLSPALPLSHSPTLPLSRSPALPLSQSPRPTPDPSDKRRPSPRAAAAQPARPRAGKGRIAPRPPVSAPRGWRRGPGASRAR